MLRLPLSRRGLLLRPRSFASSSSSSSPLSTASSPPGPGSSAEPVDVLIVGGGVVGMSSALHLKEAQPSLRVAVVERDPSYTQCSAVLSAGGIRQQFSLKENVEMSLYGKDFLGGVKERLHVDGEDPVDVQFREDGYLFLASSDAGEATLLRNQATQRSAGCDWVDVLPAEELRAQFPWLNCDDIVAGSLGQRGCGEGAGERGREKRRGVCSVYDARVRCVCVCVCV